jgi:hypothetical protein
MNWFRVVYIYGFDFTDAVALVSAFTVTVIDVKLDSSTQPVTVV